MKVCGYAVLLLLVLLAGCGGGGSGSQSSGPPPPASAGSMSAYMDSQAQSGQFTGAVLVARGDTVLVDKGYGWADSGKMILNTPQTKFRIGSNSKQFTAMAILLLEQQGKLHVSDHLCQYIAACPDAWKDVTLFHLLTHSSGIPDYTNFGNFPSLIGTPVSVTDLLTRFEPFPLVITPGGRWTYSNSNYVLLGYIIEKTSGVAYSAYLQQAIFTPLHMNNTGYDQSAITAPDHAQGYLTPSQQPVFLDMSEFYAAGALYSTAEDLYLWDKALVNNTLAPAAVLAPMLTPQIACPAGGCALASDAGYGYGWFIAGEQGHRYDYHWGRIDGFISSNGVVPDQQIYVIMLSNLETSNVFQGSETVTRMMLNGAN